MQSFQDHSQDSEKTDPKEAGRTPDSGHGESPPFGFSADSSPGDFQSEESADLRAYYLSRIAGQIDSLIEHRSGSANESVLQTVLENVPKYIPEKSAIYYDGTVVVVLKAPWQMAEERIEAIQSALQTHTNHRVEVQWQQDASVGVVSGKPRPSVTIPVREFAHGSLPGSERFSREILSTAPEGVDVIKTSLYSAPLGRSRLNFSMVRAHVEQDRKQDVEAWVRQIEDKFNLGVVVQEVSRSRSSLNSLSELAEADGLVRDSAGVKQLMNGIHGVAFPQGPQVCGVAAPPSSYRDLRSEQSIAIDPPGSRDLDDVIFSEDPSYSGISRVRVSFVDAAWLIRPNSEMDLYARMAGQSFYRRNTNLPLFGDLSYNELSLLENQPRFAFTVEMDVDRNGRRIQHDVFRSLVTNHQALDFSTAQGILEGVPHAASEQLQRLAVPVAALRSDRMQRGGLLHLDKGSSLAATLNSHMIVEELMIAARRSLAEYCRDNDVSILSKIHVQPSRQVRRDLLREIRAVGVKARMGRELTRPVDFRRMLAELDDRGEHAVLYRVLDIYMGRSRFDSLPLGHFGLGVDAYTEIKARHYAGIVVQRQLERFFEGLPALPFEALREKQRDVNLQRRNVSRKMYSLLQFERIANALQHQGEPFAVTPRYSRSGEVHFSIKEFPWRWAVSREEVPFELLSGNTPLAGILDGFDPDPQKNRLVLKDIQRANFV